MHVIREQNHLKTHLVRLLVQTCTFRKFCIVFKTLDRKFGISVGFDNFEKIQRKFFGLTDYKI